MRYTMYNNKRIISYILIVTLLELLVLYVGVGNSYMLGDKINRSSTKNIERSKRSARLDLSWSRNNGNGLIFVYDRTFLAQEIAVIRSAAAEIAQHACIYISVYSYDKYLGSGGSNNAYFQNFVFITRNSYQGCTSDIGMHGGMQRMNLDPYQGCTNSKGVIMHEMVHSLGFDHEQNRPDRDNFVLINFRNVAPGKENDFKVKRGVTAIGPYDYSSIMQYGAYSFSYSQGFPTIISRRNGYNVPSWNPSDLSHIDKKKIRYITGCKSAF